jgi:Leucine-rich repeat (LRR) protein
LQCELARQPLQVSRLDPLEKDLLHESQPEQRIRETELLQAHERAWAGPVADVCIKWMFHRGFVAFIEISAQQFVAHAPALFAAHPIRFATIQKPQRYVRGLADSPCLARLTGLSLGQNDLTAEDLEYLLGSCHFPQLKQLILSNNRLSDRHAALIASAAPLHSLEVLDLAYNDIRNRGVQTLVGSPILAQLNTLLLQKNSVRTLGAKALAESPFLQHLRFLDLRGNPIPRTSVDLLRQRFGREIFEI